MEDVFLLHDTTERIYQIKSTRKIDEVSAFWKNYIKENLMKDAFHDFY